MARRIDKPALMYAADLLKRQDYSELRLRQKLTQRNYPAEEIDDVIEKLKKYKYLNDKKICVNQFELFYKSNKYSIRQIRIKLIKLGFNRQLIDSLVPDDIDEHENTAALKLLNARFKTLPDNKKMYQFLSAKGFNSSTIFPVIDEFKNQFEYQSKIYIMQSKKFDFQLLS